jgi:REP element-mobilizing transposase RayT
MPETLGYHLTKTTYGTWLPGDARGSWVKNWSPRVGYGELHRFEHADPSREERSRRQLSHDVVILSPAMIQAVVDALAVCIQRSQGGLKIMAATIEPTHMHLLLTRTCRNIDITTKWIADQTTKAIHRQTAQRGSVWTSKNWCEHVDQPDHWEELLRYIDEHHVRAGRGSRPYEFLCEIEL